MRYPAAVLLLAIVAGACTTVLPSASPAPGGGVPAAFADMDSVRSEVLAPGVTHVRAYDPRGPWTIHVVTVNAAVCSPVFQVRKPEGRLSSRATTTELSGAALVSINADFFRLPGGTPVGAQVSDGVPLIGPTDWPVFAVTTAGQWRAGRARVQGWIRARGDSARVVQINRPAAAFSSYSGTAAGVTLFTSRSDTLPADSVASRLRLRLLDGSEREGRGVVVARDVATDATVVDPGTVVLLARGDADAWANRRAAGDTVTWHAQVMVLDEAGNAEVAQEVVGGFPHLLRSGQDVLGTQTVNASFGMNRHPRTAIGWNETRREFYMVVVDGRQAPYSDGMSLPEMTWLFRRLGAPDALNLDGGGSTALVIRGSLVNRPSDQQGERAVGNALTLDRCEAPRR